MSLGAAEPAFADLKIELIFVDNAPPASPKIMTGGGELQKIMRVAAKNWERVFKSGNGNWKLTIEYGWAPLVSKYGGFAAQGSTLLVDVTAPRPFAGAAILIGNGGPHIAEQLDARAEHDHETDRVPVALDA